MSNISSIYTPVFSYLQNEVRVKNFFDQYKQIIAIVTAAFALLAIAYAISRYCFNPVHLFTKENPKLDEKSIENLLKKNPKLDPIWINNNSNTPLKDLGLNDHDVLKDFIQKLGDQLTSLNLTGHAINNAQFEELIKLCPNLSYLSIDSNQIDDSALANLKGMSLTTVNFCNCHKLTDNALAHLQGLPLQSVDFSGCENLTDNALKHFQGMSLRSVAFSGCKNLTGKALSHLIGMPLSSVAFISCHKLTDNALLYLKGMPLQNVAFSECFYLTDNALSHLKGMPLTNVHFDRCPLITKDALAKLIPASS